MSGRIRSEIDGRICTLTIENEGKRNALNYAMIEELIGEFETLEDRGTTTVVVMRGAGEKAFSAGADLTEDRSDRTEEQKGLWPRLARTIECYDYPVIAMVNGDTFGGAMEVIAACDLRVGVDDARFGITPANLGLVYRGDAINRVINVIGFPKTREMLFTADPIGAEHAEEIGLLNYAVGRDELEERTYGIAESIASNAPLSLRYMKDILDTIAEKRRLSEAENRWVRRIRDETFASEDHEEGVEAFSEGRDPEFEGR